MSGERGKREDEGVIKGVRTKTNKLFWRGTRFGLALVAMANSFRFVKQAVCQFYATINCISNSTRSPT